MRTSRSKLFETLNQTTLSKYQKLKAKVVEGLSFKKKDNTIMVEEDSRISNEPSLRLSFNSSHSSLSSTLFLPDEDITEDHEPQARGLYTTGPRYSNYYIKLPNGNWLVQYRTWDEKVISSYEIMGHLI